MQQRPQIIETEHLKLHPISPSDETNLIEILTNPIINATYVVPQLDTPEKKHQLFQKLMKVSNDLDKFVYGIYLDNNLIGLINEVENNGKIIELGYAISPNEQNKGYATETLSACIAALFLMGYLSVKTGAFENNIASMRVMEKSGMKKCEFTEAFEHNGIVHNCIIYMIDNPIT